MAAILFVTILLASHLLSTTADTMCDEALGYCVITNLNSQLIDRTIPISGHLLGDNFHTLLYERSTLPLFTAKELCEIHMQLRKVEAKSCSIQLIPENSFDSCHKLEEVNLARNQIKSLSQNIFNRNLALKRIILNSNQISQVHFELFKNLDELVVLDVGHNLLRDLPGEIFHDNINLVKLDLSYNNLQRITSQIFSGLQQLKVLYLNNNKILSVAPMAFMDLVKLENLFLQGNDIETLDDKLFEKIRSLKELQLSSNKLKTVPKEVFEVLVHLKRLDLDENRICYLNFVNEIKFNEALKVNVSKNYVRCGDIEELKLLKPGVFIGENCLNNEEHNKECFRAS